MIRPALIKDIPAIVDLGIEALERFPEERLLISKDKVAALASDCVQKNSNFAWVAEKDGIVVGAVCAQVHEMVLYERSQATVVQYYCRVPGEGVNLLRRFLRWAYSRRMIKMVVFEVEIGQDPRIYKLLKWWGFKVAEETWIKIR